MTQLKEHGSAKWIGQSIPPKEGRRLVAGEGTFTDDVTAVGQLHCAILRSSHAHARIVKVDTSRARQIPGVVAVVSGEDAKPRWNPIPLSMALLGMQNLAPVYALATEKVYYQGEAIAAIAAEAPEIAEDALAAIEVTYEDLPVVMGIEQSLGVNGAAPETLLYEEWGNNVQCASIFSYGPVDEAFASAHLVVSEHISVQRYGGMPLEARAVLAEFDARRNELTVRTSTQIPHQVRSLIATLFNLPESNVRILVGDVGGGFGNKMQIDAEVIPILLSILTHRPVKWVENRSQWMMSGPHGRDYVHDIEAAFDSHGTLLAVRDHIVADVGCDGAVRTGGLPAPLVSGIYIPGPYKVQAISTHVQAVVTNKAPYGAVRGFGKDIANVAIERVLDQAAKALNQDTLEIRRRNLVETFPYEMCTGPIIESGNFLACLDGLERMMKLADLRAYQQQARQQGRYVGIGVVTFLEPSGGSIPMSFFSGYESATVRVAPDGTVMVLTGIQQVGQGIQTTFAQVTADSLGCKPEDVRVICGDTTAVPYGMGAYSSRSSTYGVTTIYKAAQQVRAKLLNAAAHMLEADVQDLELSDGGVSVKGEVQKRLSLAQIARGVYAFPGAYAVLPGEENPMLEASSGWANPQVSWRPDAAGRIRLFPAHSGGAQAALVEVDSETGEVRVEKLWVMDDSGTLINPALVEGQIIGGSIMGFGGVMLEQLRYDDNGNLQTTTLQDYQLPNFLSAPRVEVEHIETPSPITPLGTKGVGEAGCIGTQAAIMAAVEDALSLFGVKVMSSPLTPWRVLELIETSQSK